MEMPVAVAARRMRFYPISKGNENSSLVTLLRIAAAAAAAATATLILTLKAQSFYVVQL